MRLVHTWVCLGCMALMPEGALDRLPGMRTSQSIPSVPPGHLRFPIHGQANHTDGSWPNLMPTPARGLALMHQRILILAPCPSGHHVPACLTRARLPARRRRSSTTCWAPHPSSHAPSARSSPAGRAAAAGRCVRPQQQRTAAPLLAGLRRSTPPCVALPADAARCGQAHSVVLGPRWRAGVLERWC